MLPMHPEVDGGLYQSTGAGEIAAIVAKN